MRRFGRHGSGRSRHAFLFVLLLATLILTGLLAYQALDAARSHHATAQSVLQDYASLAASEFVRRCNTQLGYYGIYPALEPLARPDLPGPEPDAGKAVGGLARSYFRYRFPDDVQVRGEDDPSLLDPAALQALRRHLKGYDPEWDYALLLLPPDETVALVYRLQRAGHDLTAEGFVTDTAALGEYFKQVLEQGPLLPPSVGGGKVDNALLSVSAVGPLGGSLYQTRTPYDATIRASHQLDDGLRDIGVLVSLKPEAASQLIIGGLPNARIPLLVGLLILSSVLILVALLQLRRERELSSRQADFIAAVSHELRTPLAQIQMFSETLLLKRVRSQSEESRSLQIIAQETRRLAGLVENVIQFSRSLRRKTQLAKRPTHLLPLLEELRDYFAPLAESSGTRIRVTASPDCLVRVDSDALRLILVNLIDNAVKYGPDGQTVEMGLEHAGSAVRIWVQDQGEGIDEADRERIWKRFERLPRHRNSALAGTGIGLSVVRELTEAQGGRVWIQSSPEGGARFVVEFPILSGIPVTASSGKTETTG